MSRLLLDTQIFLWWAEDSPKLTDAVRAGLSDASAELYFSNASLWEIIIKEQIGKLSFPGPLEETIPRTIDHYRLVPLGIETRHLYRYHQLPLHHRDPFDRILVAQCLVEGLTLATSDIVLGDYGVPLLM